MGNNKLLLTAVFSPYGVQDQYAEALGMQMELINNQITRFQGVHSPRQDALSYSLYLLAENISVPTVVLDFPQWKDFTQELKNGYTHVGISFIMQNVLKAKRMAEYIRKHYPEVKIILGSYGTVIPEIQEVVPYDEICQGEGVKWLREYFGEDPELPVKHPLIKAHSYFYIYGHKSIPKYSVILSGVGCDNACDFCITSKKFGPNYIPFVKTGRELFQFCLRSEKILGYKSFTIMDENFFTHPEIAKELLQEMEKNNKTYTFFLFGAANVVKKLGIDFLTRLGVRTIWIGVESKEDVYNKTKGIDIKSLIMELQSKGITVIASGMLFLDFHDQKSIFEEIDWFVNLESDLMQFMIYTPVPTTDYYQRVESENRLTHRHWRFWSGQEYVGVQHPHFKEPQQFKKIVEFAFKKKYQEGGPFILNAAITSLQGYIYLKNLNKYNKENKFSWNPETLRYERQGEYLQDEYLLLREKLMKKVSKSMRLFLLPAMIFSPNRISRRKAKKAMRMYKEHLGNFSMKASLNSWLFVLTGTVEMIRILFCKLLGKGELVRQPRVIRKEYRL